MPSARLEVVASVNETSRVLRALADRLKTAIGRRVECTRRLGQQTFDLIRTMA